LGTNLTLLSQDTDVRQMVYSAHKWRSLERVTRTSANRVRAHRNYDNPAIWRQGSAFSQSGSAFKKWGSAFKCTRFEVCGKIGQQETFAYADNVSGHPLATGHPLARGFPDAKDGLHRLVSHQTNISAIVISH